MNNIDLKLLAVINELYKTRSVSHAAMNLDLSQSAVSMSLAKLREHFRDPLFVRTSGGMEPTPHANELINVLKEAEGLLQMALDHRVTFDPAVSDRMFHICSRDIGQLRLLPLLMRRLRELAPAVRVEIRGISENTPKLLESGEVDLVVGFMPRMGAGFCQQTLFKERYVCAVSAGHPRIRNELTLPQFQQEVHLQVNTSGTGHVVVERAMMNKGIRRKIGLRVPSFLGVDAIIANTDLMLLLPEKMGLIMAKSGNIRLFPLPFSVPSYRVMQHWHERYSRDPANQWLRSVVAEVFMTKPERPAGGRRKRNDRKGSDVSSLEQ
ncbi:MAG TPA: LysR family transcriptional regulator [Bryobacteraceae bacterium]|nr:LysR family transcriptional regulator [Bryobacteraceae bacterium]